MSKFRKKPVVIEAFELTLRTGSEPFPQWFKDAVQRCEVVELGTDQGAICCQIRTLEGAMWANEGDFIIKGVKGELYPCKPDIFAATYDPAE